MSNSTTAARVTTRGPDYLEWRSAVLAKLAIVRVPELTPLEPPKNSAADLPTSYVVVAPGGLVFFVVAKGYSSFRLKIDPEQIPVLEWEAAADLVRAARESVTPVVLFLFDADRDHGRFLRLDTLPEPEAGARSVVLSFPIENTITRDSIQNLAAELGRTRRAG
jgi:hypothetical protein